MTYGSTIGIKFYEDGSVRRYPGNTCIADITPECPAYAVMTKLRKLMEESEIGKHFIFLPADSYHMTVIRGLNDQVREVPYWPECLPKDTPMEKVDDHVAAAIEAAGLPGRIRMKFRDIHTSKNCMIVRLFPADEAEEKMLRDFRDRAAKGIGVFFPKHETYGFHISLAYTLTVPEGEDAERLEALTKEINEMLQKEPVFETMPPYVAYFDDMYAFSPVRIPRD